mgnify:CR=1 FL=1
MFASEAKSIPEVADVTPCENEFFEAFQHCYLTTLWKEVEEVPPASYLTYDLRSQEMQVVSYWDFQPRTIRLDTAQEELESLLEDAVKLRLRSDVPYALYSSGGLDSSLLASFHPFAHTFCFDSTDPTLEQEFFDKIDRLLWHLDFPVGSFGFFGMWKLAQAASQ